MKNNWPETIEELLEECQRLIRKNDLYELGKRGEPYTGEIEPRVDGTDYLAGEYQYGVSMIPAQWVTHVISKATLGRGTCHIVKTWSDSDYDEDWRYRCSECGCFIGVYERDPKTGDVISADNYCPNCGREVVE